jgi:hypothetical protein
MKITVREIIQACTLPDGTHGPKAISVATRASGRRLSVKSVYSWHRIGIPQWHWPTVMKLAPTVTERDLLAANMALDVDDEPPRKRRSKRNRTSKSDRQAAA